MSELKNEVIISSDLQQKIIGIASALGKDPSDFLNETIKASISKYLTDAGEVPSERGYIIYNGYNIQKEECYLLGRITIYDTPYCRVLTMNGSFMSVPECDFEPIKK